MKMKQAQEITLEWLDGIAIEVEKLREAISILLDFAREFADENYEVENGN